MSATTPEKNTKRRETLGNTNQNKTTRTAGHKKVYAEGVYKHTKPNIQNLRSLVKFWTKQKALTIIARQNRPKEKALKRPVKLKRSLTKTTMRRTEPYKMLKRTTKPPRRRVLIEEGPAESSKKQQHSQSTDNWYLCKAASFSNSKSKPLRRRVLIKEGRAKSSKKQQHSENTDKWHLCKAGSFSYGESPQTPPLEGNSLHRWNNSVERPWGILSLFTTCLRLCVKSPCHSLWYVHYPRKAN